MVFLNRHRRGLTVLALALIAICVTVFTKCRVGAVYDICREITAGTTAGRQALVGSAWYSPLTLLLHLPFCAFLPPESACTIYRIIVLFIFASACVRFVTKSARCDITKEQACHSSATHDLKCGDHNTTATLNETDATGEGEMSADGAFRAILALDAFALVAFARNTVELTALTFALYSTLKLFGWCSSYKLADWVKMSLALAATVLCGLSFSGWAIAVLLLLPIAIACDKATRPRITGLMFLVCTPIAYVIGCWLLASYLVIGNAFYAWRFFGGIKVALNPFFVKFIAAGLVCAIGFACFRKKNYAILSAVAALAFVWFGALDSCGLGWTKPFSKEREALKSPNRPAIVNYVNNATPWGRVFICGYNGIHRGYLNILKFEIIEPCVDLHIDVLRKAYSRQHIFILVPKPICENALESCNWRYGNLYANGAQRLLFAEDFGDWRLYEVISSEK